MISAASAAEPAREVTREVAPEPARQVARQVAPAVTGTSVYCVDWLPGADRLLGTCHCGAVIVADDPVRLWEWLLSHPDHR